MHVHVCELCCMWTEHTIYRVVGNIQYTQGMTILDEYKVVQYSNYMEECFAHEGDPEQAKGVFRG